MRISGWISESNNSSSLLPTPKTMMGHCDKSPRLKQLKIITYDVLMVSFIVLKALLIPVDFLFQGFRIYVWSCFSVYFVRCFGACFKFIDGNIFTCIDCRYTDSGFPATAKSVNSKNAEGKFFAWMRAYELSQAKEKKDPTLFSNGVSAGDLAQGGLGDCWLIAAIAALAEFPGLIQRVFVTKETSEWGRYQIKLFDISKPSEGGGDAAKGSFVTVTIDDRLPCSVDGGFPNTLYLQMSKEGEIWPLLLEKAMAKWAGSYESLDGGHAAWALATLTGWETISYAKYGGGSEWTKCKLSPHPEKPRSPHDVKFVSMREECEDNEFFELLKTWEKNEFVMCASSGSGKDTVDDSQGGIVQGHAYTLIGAHEIGQTKLVQLRNPWGKFEWTGKWSDNDAAWEAHPEVKKALKPTFEDDGIFYMSFEDFVNSYRKVDVCMREVTANTDLFLDVAEEDGCIGPSKACADGCFKFLTGAGYKATCGGRENESDQLRLRWFNRSVSFLWMEWKKERAARAPAATTAGPPRTTSV
jgi:calpain-15